MEPFDTIATTLAGQKPQPSAAAKPSGGKTTGVADFSTAREVRANQMRAQGLDPATGDPLPAPAKSATPALRSTGSGVMDAMYAHANKVHPVGK